MKNQVKQLLILTLFLLSAGGFLMHYFFHPIAQNSFGYVPFFSGVLSVIVIPLLFEFKKTIHPAYLLNGFTALVGFITMAHFSIVKTPIIPDLLLVMAKFLIGAVIFRIELFPMEAEAKNMGRRTFRYPFMGFWLVHLAALSLVYWLGNILWR